ncbi:MAG: multidrug efflux SMR transporter [Sphingomonadaceae bacterium]
MAWAALIFAGLMEVTFTTFLRLADGFRNPGPSIGFFLAASASFFLLERAARVIPLGIAYAVWVGIGAVGTILVGWRFFGEVLSPVQVLLLFVLMGAVLGLRLVTPG